MVHGACSSSGCFAMTDQGVGEIYAMVEKALLSGQKRVQVQSFPFRMTQSNMSSHRDDSNLNFWRNLKEGYDAFDTTRREPIVSACGARYVFNKSFEVEGSLDPLKACPPETSIPLADMAVARQPAPEDAEEAPLHVNAYVDGGMNRDYRQLLKKYGPLKLAKKVSTTSYPISRPEAALSDPFEK